MDERLKFVARLLEGEKMAVLSPFFANLEGHVATDGRCVCAIKWHRGSSNRNIAGRNSKKWRPAISEVLDIQDQAKVAP